MVEVGAAESSGGRKPVLLDMNARARYAVGIKLAPDRVQAAVCDLQAWVVGRTEAPVDRRQGVAAILPAIAGAVRDLEALASDVAVARIARQSLAAGEPTALRELAEGDPARVTRELVVLAARAGDRLARRLLPEAGEHAVSVHVRGRGSMKLSLPARVLLYLALTAGAFAMALPFVHLVTAALTRYAHPLPYPPRLGPVAPTLSSAPFSCAVTSPACPGNWKGPCGWTAAVTGSSSATWCCP